MNDRFGEVMKQNLRLRQCSLSGVAACQNLDTQRKRFVMLNPLQYKWFYDHNQKYSSKQVCRQ